MSSTKVWEELDVTARCILFGSLFHGKVAEANGPIWKRVWFGPLQAYVADKGDRDAKVMEGRYVGTRGRNCDVLCMTEEEGVLKGNTVRRMPPQERWCKEGLDKLVGVFWNL